MTSLRSTLEQVARELNSREAAWAVIGGLAVSARLGSARLGSARLGSARLGSARLGSARSEPQFTHDVDVSVAVKSEAEALVLALTQRGYKVLATVEQEATKRRVTIRLGAPGETLVVVDLLFASSGIEREVVVSANLIEILAGMVMPVATVSHLIALKVLSSSPQRPRDFEDLRALIREATGEVTGQNGDD